VPATSSSPGRSEAGVDRLETSGEAEPPARTRAPALVAHRLEGDDARMSDTDLQDQPPLADAPPGTRPGDPVPPAARAFQQLNRWFMTPALGAGLGSWLSTPLGGWMVLLRVRGRKSGLVRETPLNYLVAEGSVWVLAGFGPRAEWYRNLVADPSVEAWLPGRRIAGVATEVRTPDVRRRIIPAIVRATLGPSMAARLDPWRATDDQLLQQLAWVPLIRIDADEGWLDAGHDDPGGRAWIWRQALVLGGCWLAWRVVRGIARRRWR
jgi:deazaflavin-dependent oxidoreductase (nitroreductase family)